MLNIPERKTRIYFPFLCILLVGLGLRIFYFPYNLPLTSDSIDYFRYATEIVILGHLPTTWTPINNGWPIFLSFWFSIINLENSFDYMQVQRAISIILSSLITIPVYFLCKRFFDNKLALVGAALFAFDPRIILNSTLGITEPLFILLGVTSLVIFLKYDRKSIIISFMLAAMCTTVRSEGVFLFLTLTILFFVKYRISKNIVKTYLPSMVIFFLILVPIMDYRIDITGTDGIFLRASGEASSILSDANQSGTNRISEGIGLFLKYLGWIMIPNFLIFLPLGVIQFLRKRNKDTNFIIILTIISSIPILYAYIVQAQDTRYFYFLFPIFCLISLFSVKSFLSKIKRKNLLIVILIVGIFVASISFYEYKKINFDDEKEMYEIAKITKSIVNGVNYHPTETAYIRSSEIPEKWPFIFHDEMYKIKIIQTNDFNNLENFILKSKNKLTHIIIDKNEKLPEFLKTVFSNEEKYEYLEKVFDSKDEGFKHHVKIFKINFQKFNNIEN